MWIPLSFRGILAVSIALTGVAIFYTYLNSKEKAEYRSATGPLIYLDKQLGEWPARKFGKFRYLKVMGYPYPFEIFVGKESGDFNPKFEQIDKLTVGDTIAVFYYETNDVEKDGLNRFAQFIDKNSDSYFERGSKATTLGVIILTICGVLAVGAFVLWKMNKIEF